MKRFSSFKSSIATKGLEDAICYGYQSDNKSIYDTIIDFLSAIRKINTLRINAVKLEDTKRTAEGKIFMNFSAAISANALIDELIKRSGDKIHITAKYKDMPVYFTINLFDNVVIMTIDKNIDIYELENALIRV